MTLPSIVTSLLLQHSPPEAKPLPSTWQLLPVDIDIHHYRRLYRLVGDEYRWTDRLKMSDDDLDAILQHPLVRVVVLRNGDVDVGYYELDARRDGWVQLAYFGLAPDVVGKGGGRAFLHAALHDAWRWRRELWPDNHDAHEHGVWVHTCTLDHPLALPLYESCGFVAYAKGPKEMHPAEAARRR